ncbi:DUF4832 domain-containing protein [Anaerolineales bacterium]
MQKIIILCMLLLFSVPGSLAQDDLETVEFTARKDYIVNPGIGWQNYEGTEALLPETVIYPDRAEISWQILNPAEGIYNWYPLESRMSAAVKQGKQISFRIYTMIGEEYGGHQVPEWVVDKGVKILTTGEPDYTSCAYQEAWGYFVDELITRYDGSPFIAFIDISGYGPFNEWSWSDDVTEWDDLWYEDYNAGIADSDSFETLDGQARRRLSDIFIGGSFDKHECRDKSGEIQTVSYSYKGFQGTQLVMPFAGVRQASEYVYLKRDDVGFRHDCLGIWGRSEDIMEGLGDILDDLWKTNPVVFEFCAPVDDDYLPPSEELLQSAHGSLVHFNRQEATSEQMEYLLRYVGYRYELEQAQYQTEGTPGSELIIKMDWKNVGYAPSYPRMGQILTLHLYVVESEDDFFLLDYPLADSLSEWLPADPIGEAVPIQKIDASITIPEGFAEGNYRLKFAIINERTNQPITLAIEGADALGYYLLGDFKVSKP